MEPNSFWLWNSPLQVSCLHNRNQQQVLLLDGNLFMKCSIASKSQLKKKKIPSQTAKVRAGKYSQPLQKKLLRALLVFGKFSSHPGAPCLWYSLLKATGQLPSLSSASLPYKEKGKFKWQPLYTNAFPLRNGNIQNSLNVFCSVLQNPSAIIKCADSNHLSYSIQTLLKLDLIHEVA